MPIEMCERMMIVFWNSVGHCGEVPAQPKSALIG